MRSSRITLFAAIVLFNASFSLSIAASTPVVQSGQTKCYLVDGTETACNGTGQDGELKPGVAWPAPRFTDNTDGTITDNLTGLLWSKNTGTPGPATSLCSKTGSNTNWQEALDHVKCMNQYRYLGFNDWRLPTAEEVASMVNYSAGDQQAWLTSSGFTSPSFTGSNGIYYYWTSSTQTDNTTNAFVLDRGNGNISSVIKTQSFYGSGVNSNSWFSYGSPGTSCTLSGSTSNVACGTTVYISTYSYSCSGTTTKNCTFSAVWPVRGNL